MLNGLAHTRGRRRRLEWALLAAALLGLVAWLSPPGRLLALNHWVQDTALRLAARPAQPGIAIIAIDDRSIAAIGRWPWRRALHAELVRRVSEQAPRAIGMDVLFSEEDLDYPADDALLADALARSARVVLPVVRRGHGPAGGNATDLPWPGFAQAAAGLGHVHVAPDNDGVVRSLYLREGPAGAPWPHLAVAMQCLGGAQEAVQAGTPADPDCAAPSADAATGPWQRSGRMPIAYAGGPGHFATYSYIDVLRGQVPADALRGKYVLVGAAAAGLGDLFATPASRAEQLMPGVEVAAHVLDARLAGVHLRPAPGALNTAFNLAPVACALLALLLLGPLAGLLTSAALALATLALAVGLAWGPGLQFAPAAALVGLGLAYPLWSWRRLSAAAHFLRLEMDRLQREGLPVGAPRPAGGGGAPDDFLDKRINAVEHASRQLRDLHHFVSQSLQQLPSATLVCDPQGRILLANTAARQHLGGDRRVPLRGQNVAALLGDLVDVGSGQPLVTPERLLAQGLPDQAEGRDASGRSLLLLCKPFTDAANAGWLLTLVDLTEMQRALRQRDQALHFISHDIRAPNASILTLLEMDRAAPGRMAPQEMMQRIERYARASLGMAEGFVQLASAQSQEYRMERVDLAPLLADAVDDTWALARERGVSVTVDGHPPDTAATLGDRALLARALANVLNNAVKFSPDGATVRCTLAPRGSSHWVLAVADEGPGIPPEQQGRLFTPFQRLHGQSHPQVGGVGLGLAFVHTVVLRHGGTLEVHSDGQRGTEFRLVLPQAREGLEDGVPLENGTA